MYMVVHKKWNMYAEICALLVMVFSLKITEAKALIFFAIRLIFKIIRCDSIHNAINKHYTNKNETFHFLVIPCTG